MDLNKLNNEQRDAVTSTHGPLLVLAGAGSGKTRVLTCRIAYIIEHDGINPFNILALTFTNKAAREMKDRVAGLVGDVARGMWIFTFHSFCARILRTEAEYAGYKPSFTIYDDDDSIKLIAKILKEMNISDKDLTKRDARYAISNAKNTSLNPIEILLEHETCSNILPDVYKEYQRRLKLANALDFDDLLTVTIKLFADNERILQKYRKKFKYVLVDEYQDTNVVQYKLLHQLCCEHQNICVVGDDDQSIYGWRGATIKNILDFERNYPGAKVVRLEQNYRSTKTILDAANCVISNNTQRKSKKLWTDGLKGDNITLYDAEDERGEANYICKRIIEGVRSGRRYSDFAVLYRNNAQSRSIESALVGYGIPYALYGGVRFYDRAEVKDALSYMRLIFNPSDDAALSRIINVPRRQIGDAAISELTELGREFGVSMYEACHMYDRLSGRIRNKIQDFNIIIDELIAQCETVMPSELTQKLLQRIHYVESLDPETRESREQNIKELIGDMARSEAGSDSPREALMLYLERAALVSDADAIDEEGGACMLMTMHSSKGLEFREVFLPGFEDGIFPGMRAVREAGTMEEERRLCYVAITRAREKLHIICAESRFLYGNRDHNDRSFFLTEIPDELIEEKSFRDKEGRRDSKGFAQKLSGYQSVDSGARTTSSNPANESKADANRYFQKYSSVPKTFMRDTAPSSEPPKPRPKDFKRYDRVRHDTFGDGIIVETAGSSEAMLVTVEFDDGKRKKFAAAYAPMTKI